MKANEIPEATDIPITAPLLREWLVPAGLDVSPAFVFVGELDDTEWLPLVVV